MSVDTSLASVVSGSKMNSGSEMLNAHNIHQLLRMLQDAMEHYYY